MDEHWLVLDYSLVGQDNRMGDGQLAVPSPTFKTLNLIMTPLDIILIPLCWVLIGGFVCVKRNWYKHLGRSDKEMACFVAFLVSPVILLIALFKVFIVNEWHNES